MKSSILPVFATAAVFLLAGCSEPPPPLPPVQLGGTNSLPAGQQAGYDFAAEWAGHRICKLTLIKPAKFTEPELNVLLAANAEGHIWSEVPARLDPVGQRLGLRRWERSDRASALLIPGDKTNTLQLIGPPRLPASPTP